MKKYLFLAVFIVLIFIIIFMNKNTNIYIDLNNIDNIKTYKIDEFDDFYSDYKNNKLDDIYITEFIFDGVSMYKPYDIENTSDILKITTLNINGKANYILKGKMNGMILVNTNNIKGDINLIFDNVNIDTLNKDVPAIYIYNKDTNYLRCNVKIKTLKNTDNYIVGGKFKKVSLMPIDELDQYNGIYTSYSNYYGIYNSLEVNDILFAKVKASKENIKNKDPHFYYKASGVISSDINLTFEGNGYLNIKSYNDEGIESKNNLIFNGGSYEIESFDDAINGNDITINVDKLTANVLKAGDAIDANGELTINNGNIYAISNGDNSGLDASLGTIINGGVILSVDAYDDILDKSNQPYIKLMFNHKVKDSIVMRDSNDNVVFEYTSLRPYKNLIYSSKLSGSYKLYKKINDEYVKLKDINIDGISNIYDIDN